MAKHLTESQARALTIVRDNPSIGNREFAEKMWPDSPGHNRAHKCGYGTSRGSMMAMVGASYLARLWKAKLLSRSGRFGGPPAYYLTSEGRRLLKLENEE